MLNNIILIFIGGGLGSVLRFIVSSNIAEKVSSGIPWGTFAVNVIGSFLLGSIIGLAHKMELASSQYLVLFTIGFCGGFTTFSTFAYENILAVKSGQFLVAILYTAISIVVGLIAAFAGLSIFKAG